MKKQQLLRSLSRQEQITNSEDIRILIQLLRDQPARLAQLSECAGEHLTNQLPQLMSYLVKCSNIADAVGVIVKNSCTSTEALLTILNPLQQNPYCLTRIVQYLPYDLLEQNALWLLRQFIQLLGLQNSRVAVLEGMAAIILSVEEQSFVFADEVLPYLPSLLSDSQWQVQKMAMDILYSLIVLQREKITPEFTEIIYKLSQDKVYEQINQIKQVRDSANLILQILEVDGQQLSTQLPSQLLCTQSQQQLPTLQPSISQPIIQLPPIQQPTTLQPSVQQLITQQPSIQLTIQQPPIQQPTIQQPSPITLQPQSHQLTVQEKLDLAIDAISNLTQLLKNKGICDTTELQPIENILTRISEPPLQESYSPPLQDSLLSGESYISKEAAAILREFREKQLRQ